MLLTDANGLGSAYMPQSGSPLLNAADFTTAPAAFDKVNFIGAISPADNWLSGWTNFNPQNTAY